RVTAQVKKSLAETRAPAVTSVGGASQGVRQVDSHSTHALAPPPEQTHRCTLLASPGQSRKPLLPSFALESPQASTHAAARAPAWQLAPLHHWPAAQLPQRYPHGLRPQAAPAHELAVQEQSPPSSCEPPPPPASAAPPPV